MALYRIAYRGFSYVEAGSPEEAAELWHEDERLVDMVVTDEPEEVKDLGAFEGIFEEAADDD